MTASFDLIPRKPVQTVSDLVRDVADVRKSSDQHKLWFRGHSDASFRLRATIGRKAEYGGRKKQFTRRDEEQLLHRFRRRAFPQDRSVTNAGYAIFLARHHGLPTRLLDWTANALFALYFCCADEPESDGHLWAFRQRSYEHVLDAFGIAQAQTEADLFERIEGSNRVKIVHPVFNSARLVAQDGGFTWQSDPWTPLEELAGQQFEERDLDIKHLYRWQIPATCKASLLRELSGLGVSHRSVYPDLDGIARSLWETEVLWNWAV